MELICKNLGKMLDKFNTVSIIGMCKNAGKTTVLNRILRDFYHSNITCGITSVGRDGESTDVVTITPKPEIFVQKGTLVATAKNLLKHCSTTNEILLTTGINTPLGEVVIFRTLSGGYVQIAGPSIVQQLNNVTCAFKNFGADKVVVDGAISRRSLSSANITDATILSTGASLSPDMDTVVSETAHIVNLLTLPVTKESYPEFDSKYIAGYEDKFLPFDNLTDIYSAEPPKSVYIKGSLTDTVIKPLINKGIDIKDVEFCLFDSSKIFITPDVFEKLQSKGARLAVKHDVNLIAVTANPVSAYGHRFDADKFLKALRKNISLPVIDVEKDYDNC
jgi:hypothetical protein